MSYKMLNIALVMILFVSGFSFAAAAGAKSANFAKEVAEESMLAEVVSQCPDSPIKVDCSSQDRNTREWIGADGCKYECRASSPPASTCPKNAIVVDCADTDRAASEWTGSDGCRYKCAEIKTTPKCPAKAVILDDCGATDSATSGSKTWTDSQGCAHACKKITPPASGNCKNPAVPAACFDGVHTAYMYKDTNGCFQYGCMVPTKPWYAPVVVDCGASDADRPNAEFWWDGDGIYHICSSSSLMKWLYTPVGTACGNQDPALQKAVVAQRIQRNCGDNSEIKRYELWLKAHDVNGNPTTYCNFVCQNRYYEQCIADGTFDSYVDEWCLDANGNKIVPLSSGGLSEDIYISKSAATTVNVPAPVATSSSDTSAAETAPSPAPAPYKLALSKGWNMVSLPVNARLSMEKVAAACGSQKYAWKYGPSGYTKETTLVPGTGYWIKASAGCAVEVPGGQFTGPLASLSAGWNLVGATWDGINIKDYTGTCSITSGPWYYSSSNAADSPYTASSTLSQGKAYWIKVASACSLDSEAVPPSPPN